MPGGQASQCGPAEYSARRKAPVSTGVRGGPADAVDGWVGQEERVVRGPGSFAAVALGAVLALALGAAPAAADERLTILRRTAVLERPREPSPAVVVVEPGL